MYDEDNPLGLDFTTPINPLEALQEAASSALNFVHGAVRYVPQALTDFRRSVKQDAERLQQPVLPTNRPPTPVETVQGYATGQERFEAKTMERTASFLESIGAPEPIAGLGAGITGLVLPGPGDIKLTATAGSMALMPMLGRVTSEQGKRLVKRSEEVEKLGSAIEDYRSINKMSRVAKKEAEMSSAQSNVLPFTQEDPKLYPPKLKAASQAVSAERLKRATTEELHLHHKLPKGMSAAFFDRMDYFISRDVAVSDDLIEMAEEARKLGLSTGDRKSNMLIIPRDPHMSFHTEMRTMGDVGKFGEIELGKKDLQKILLKTKDPTSLKALWKAWLTEDAKYLVETAEVWEPLDNLLKEIRKK
jgi:hypothetical protein